MQATMLASIDFMKLVMLVIFVVPVLEAEETVQDLPKNYVVNEGGK